MNRSLIVGLWFVFLPTLAAGQTIDECSDRQKLTEMAIEVRERVEKGESEESLLNWAENIEAPGLQAAGYKAVQAYTFSPPSQNIPMVVTVMSYLCSKAYRP